jgi:hypothetical protein
MDLNILCVKWGTKFSADYVNRLYNMVQRNLTLPHDFYCLTEDSTGLQDGIKVIPFTQSDLEYCWNKLILFDDLPITGTALYFDLDVVITGNIDELITHRQSEPFMGILDWNRPKQPQFNASVMRYNVNEFKYIINRFRKQVESGKLVKKREWDAYLKSNDKVVYFQGAKRFGGDQEWTSDILISETGRQVADMSYSDKWILSYRTHCKRGLPAGSKVVIMHGDPKPHQIKDQWVKDHWK